MEKPDPLEQVTFCGNGKDSELRDVKESLRQLQEQHSAKQVEIGQYLSNKDSQIEEAQSRLETALAK